MSKVIRLPRAHKTTASVLAKHKRKLGYRATYSGNYNIFDFRDSYLKEASNVALPVFAQSRKNANKVFMAGTMSSLLTLLEKKENKDG